MKKTPIIRFRQVKLFFNNIIQTIGEHIEKRSISQDIIECELENCLDERGFYERYIYLKIALMKAAKADTGLESLTFVNVMHLALIMCKDDDFVMPALGRNKLQVKLAAESGRSTKSLYSSITRLKRAGLLVVSEDGLIELSPELRTLRKITKQNLNLTGLFPVSYVINFIVQSK